MDDVAVTQFASVGGSEVAYQVLGEGSADVIAIHPQYWPIDLMCEEPALAYSLERLSSFCRHIWFDPRGRAASGDLTTTDRPLDEDIADDMLAILDATGSDRAVILDLAVGCTGLLFAAAHPQRTAGLIVVNGCARWRQADDYPDGIPDDLIDAVLPRVARQWGTEAAAYSVAPSLADRPSFRRWLARAQRLTTTREHNAWRFQRAFESDVRQILPVIETPALVVHRRDNLAVPVALGRYLAEHLPHANYAELPGADQFFFAGDADSVIDAIEEFVTGERPQVDVNRVLATILFTDIVNSTRHVREKGDRVWRGILDRYNEIADRQIARFRGSKVKTTGDGTLATFDGPARAIRCAQAISNDVKELGIQIRAGVHTGEVELHADDIAGIAVHVGARVSAIARSDEVLVSSIVKDLVAGSDLNFEDRGNHELKGVHGSWRLFAVRP